MEREREEERRKLEKEMEQLKEVRVKGLEVDILEKESEINQLKGKVD